MSQTAAATAGTRSAESLPVDSRGARSTQKQEEKGMGEKGRTAARATWICLYFSTIAILFAGDVAAQVDVSRRIDVAGKLERGEVQAVVEPRFTNGSIETIFDGNHLTEAGVTNDSTLAITLSFGQPIAFGKTRLFFWNTGKWTLEAADSLADLETQSGTYRLLARGRDCVAFAWDSLSFSPVSARIIRLTAWNEQSKLVLLGEWEIWSSVRMVRLAILPSPLKLIPGTSTQLTVRLVDEAGRTYPYDLPEHVAWSSSNRDVATVGEMGEIQAHAIGTATITARTSSLTGTTTVQVVEDFESPKAETLVVNVALVLQDPVIDPVNKRKIHQVRGWADPFSLVEQILNEFRRVSDGVVQFRIVEVHDDNISFTRLDGEFMTIDTLAYYYSSLSRLYGRTREGTLQNLAEVQGRVQFDYNAMIDYYDLDTKRNNGEVSEVWVYGPPFAGMYESRLVGPNGFWYNSPPLEHPGLEKLLPVMGWNYERGVAEALHSYGHRVESAMVHTYGGRWDVHAEDPTAWEIFTRIDKDLPGQAHVGNIHYPPNGMSDYDYGNRRYVITYADNWKRYPILLDQTRTINCEEWGCSQLGYMRWWFSHLPRYAGVTDGVLNNWWYYVIDYDAAVEKAREYVAAVGGSGSAESPPGTCSLEQNFPNPFNPVTAIRYSLARPGRVTLKVYDTLGREVANLVDGWQTAGPHQVIFDARGLPSGVYLYRIEAGRFVRTRKLLLLK